MSHAVLGFLVWLNRIGWYWSGLFSLCLLLFSPRCVISISPFSVNFLMLFSLLLGMRSQYFCHVLRIRFWASFIRSLVGIFVIKWVDAEVTASFSIASVFSLPRIPTWNGTYIKLILFFDDEISSLRSWINSFCGVLIFNFY